MVDWDKLQESAKVLNEKKDIVTQELKEWEEHINSLRMGIAAGVKVPNGAILGYGRVAEKKWGFYYRESDDPQAPLVHIFDAPFMARLGMYAHIDLVFRALLREAARTTTELKEATRRAEEMLKGIKP